MLSIDKAIDAANKFKNHDLLKICQRIKLQENTRGFTRSGILYFGIDHSHQAKILIVQVMNQVPSKLHQSVQILHLEKQSTVLHTHRYISQTSTIVLDQVLHMRNQEYDALNEEAGESSDDVAGLAASTGLVAFSHGFVGF